jgi:hypothetical protein
MDQPPYLHVFIRAIDECPTEGSHVVLIHVENRASVLLSAGKHTWPDYAVSNVVFRNIEYDVQEHDVPPLTTWTWLRSLIYGPPNVQTIALSFNVFQTV